MERAVLSTELEAILEKEEKKTQKHCVHIIMLVGGVFAECFLWLGVFLNPNQIGVFLQILFVIVLVAIVLPAVLSPAKKPEKIEQLRKCMEEIDKLEQEG